MNPWVTPVITVVAIALSGFGAYVGFRIQFERFLARDAEREKHWNKWREDITRDVEMLKMERNLHTKVAQIEAFIVELRDWKHHEVEPYIRAMGQMKQRVDQLEKKP